MANSVLEQFTSGIGQLVSNRNGAQLQDYLQLEPPLPPIYSQMVNDLRRRYPSGPHGDAELLKLCESILPNTKGAVTWSAFPPFMRLYLSFLRDVNTDNLLETYNLLKALLK
jgi:nuclear mRNA export protein PCID2/THP1